MTVLKLHPKLLALSVVLLARAAMSQNVKLANVALGMDETEVRTALAPGNPRYVRKHSEASDMEYLIVEAAAESFAFTFIEGKVVGFSVVHLLPPGQQPFLPPGQQPTVSTLRNLITKQTWTPTEKSKGDTLWLRDVSGSPISDASQCVSTSGQTWLAMGTLSDEESSKPTTEASTGLLKPALTSYPVTCGVSIHLKLTPAKSEDDVVTSVSFQVLNIKAINAFVATHHQR